MTVRGFLAWYLAAIVVVSASGAGAWLGIQSRKHLDTAVIVTPPVSETSSPSPQGFEACRADSLLMHPIRSRPSLSEASCIHQEVNCCAAAIAAVARHHAISKCDANCLGREPILDCRPQTATRPESRGTLIGTSLPADSRRPAGSLPL